jgi:hypothetical protein
MAEDGEWNRKGATLSDVTAQKDYGVTHEFLVGGVRAGALEYREGSGWGNPFFRFLRGQIESYIVSELGSDYLTTIKSKTELRAVVTQITSLKRKLSALEARKAVLEGKQKK